jgi:hypothetical protein
MHRCGTGFLLSLAIAFIVALTGCLGKSSGNTGNGGVKTVTLSPSVNTSMDVGGILVFTASGKNAAGQTVFGADIQFVVESGSQNAPAPLAIANNGSGNGIACAGSWDSTGAICSPGTPGIAIVTAVINGASSTPTTVYVHQHIDDIAISPIIPQGPPPQLYDCFSQGQSWDYQAIAYSVIAGTRVDITNSVGPMTWSSTNAGVVTTTPLFNSNQPTVLNQAQVTAKTPGITQISASVSGVTSNLYPFTTCLVQAIYLQIGGQNQTGNSVIVNTGGSVPVTAIAVDTLCGTANSTPLTNVPLTWSTTNPEVIAFGNTTSSAASNTAAARNNPGGATLTASCTPPTCNIGLPGPTASGQLVPSLPIYASDYQALSPAPKGTCQLPNMTHGYGTISVDVTLNTSTAPPTYTAWAATTGCANAPGCTSALFSVTPGTAPIGSTILTLPRTPNSLMFNHVSSPRLYIGSNQGLMYVDVGSGKLSVIGVSTISTSCNVALCGKVLTISNDGNLVVVSDTVSTPSQVYIYNAGSTTAAPIDLILSNSGETATAASFSPDQLRLFILTNKGNMYVASAVDALAELSLAGQATDVEFSADGSFAYVAGSPASSVSAYSTCSQPGVASVDIPNGSAATSSTPSQIFPSPVIPPPVALPPVAQGDFLWTTQNIVALEASEFEILTAEFAQDPIQYFDPLQLTCNAPLIYPGSFTSVATHNLGQTYTPLYSQLVADGSELLLVAQNVPAVLLFSVNSGTPTSVPLVRQGFNTSLPFAASASTDGSQVFVAACDQFLNNDPKQACVEASVHIVSVSAAGQGSDYQQVPFVNASNDNDTNMCNNAGISAPTCFPNLVAIKPQ